MNGRRSNRPLLRLHLISSTDGEKKKKLRGAAQIATHIVSGSEDGGYLFGVVGRSVGGGNELGHVVNQHELETLEPLLEGIPSVWCA